MADPNPLHYKLLVKAITEGRVIPFFGAGVNLCGRSPGEDWKVKKNLPSGGELSGYLAETFGYPEKDVTDLVRVSQFVSVMSGSGPLYDELRGVLEGEYSPTPLHEFFAALPGLLRAKGYSSKYQLIVTTNYDDLMERAFEAKNEPFDLVTYIAEGKDRGKFLHHLSNGLQLIEKPNEYLGLSLDEKPVILKIHGTVDRDDPERDSFVITEDQYIEYLTRTDISNLVPVTLAAKLRKSHFLFLGYSLKDWNLRVILHRIWGEQKLSFKSWAIQLNPDELDQRIWQDRGVEIINANLDDYISGLKNFLEGQPTKPASV